MSFFTSNVAAIVKRYHTFHEEIIEAYHASTIDVVKTSDGEISARVDGKLLHSARFPIREAERTVSTGVPDRMIACICFGFGLGFYVKAALRRFADIPIFIVEPDVPLFLAGIATRDMTDLFSDERINLLLDVSAEDAAQALTTVPPGEIHIIAPRSLCRRHDAYYEALNARLSKLINRRRINKNTLERFGNRWIRNLASNLAAISHADGVSTIADAFHDIPALVLAAGPSLDEILPHIREIAKRALIIAVDTSLQACLRAGVRPDFVVVVDPQYWNARHLDRCDTSSSIIVSESSTYPSVFHREYLNLMFCSSLFPLGEYLESRIGEFGKLGAGGSVATTAWDFARYLGCSPIFMAGLDLGFPNNQTHFKGSTFEERAHLLATRLVPAEHAAFLALRDAGPYYVSSNSNGEVLTDKRLIIYRWWFENQLEMNPGIETFTLSKRGVAIDGMEYVSAQSLKSTMPELRDEHFIKHTLASAMKRVDRTAAVELIATELLDELDRLRMLSDTAIKHIEWMERNSQYTQDRLSALERLDDEIRQSGGKEIAGFLIQQTIEEIATHTDKSEENTGFEQSLWLYRMLGDSCKFHIRELRRGMRFFDKDSHVPHRNSQ